MEIKSSWDFKELVYNLKALKQEYKVHLALFLSCYDDIKEANKYVKSVRDKFYSLKLKEWQIDICWEYMNDYKMFYEIARIFERIDK